jgi:ComF family protein
MLKKIASITQWLALTPKCILCKQNSLNHLAVCESCIYYFQPISQSCQFCATPLLKNKYRVCGSCLRKKPWVDRVFAPYFYKEPYRSLIHEFKYYEGLYLAKTLASLLLDKLPADLVGTECLLPVPLHLTRLQTRGFNQAAELAKLLAKRLGIPLALNSCVKNHATIAQAELKGFRRRQNLHDAFIFNSLPYHTVTIIDDLFTTGSTVNELARIMKMGGIQTVHVWCCARV